MDGYKISDTTWNGTVQEFEIISVGKSVPRRSVWPVSEFDQDWGFCDAIHTLAMRIVFRSQ